MHASHTTWLINSNLNGRGLTSYTYAFGWCLEKSLQHIHRARKNWKADWRKAMCDSKSERADVIERLTAPEWQLRAVAPGLSSSLATGSQHCLNYILKALIPGNSDNSSPDSKILPSSLHLGEISEFFVDKNHLITLFASSVLWVYRSSENMFSFSWRKWEQRNVIKMVAVKPPKKSQKTLKGFLKLCPKTKKLKWKTVIDSVKLKQK